MSSTCYLVTDGERIPYTLTRRSTKSITIRVHLDGSISVSAGTRTSHAQIERVLTDKLAQIKKAQAKMAKARAERPAPLSLQTGEILPLFGTPHRIVVTKDKARRAGIVGDVLYLSVKNPEDAAERYRCFAEFADATAKQYFAAEVARALPLFLPKPATMPALVFRTMKTKWGVCNSGRGKITFNRSLIFLPPPIIEYVIYHELAHFHHPNHSTHFWQFLTAKMPDCKERRHALNHYPVPTFSEAVK